MKSEFGLVASCLLLLCVLAACSAYPPPDPGKRPPDIESLRLYPGAQQVRVQRQSGAGPTFKELTTFQTGDKPEAVLAFYRRVLAKDGWEFFVPRTPIANRLGADWANGVGQPGYQVDLIAQPLAGGQTSVEITVTRAGPE